MGIDKDPFLTVQEVPININSAFALTTIEFLLAKIEEREKSRDAKHVEILEKLERKKVISQTPEGLNLQPTHPFGCPPHLMMSVERGHFRGPVYQTSMSTRLMFPSFSRFSPSYRGYY